MPRHELFHTLRRLRWELDLENYFVDEVKYEEMMDKLLNYFFFVYTFFSYLNIWAPGSSLAVVTVLKLN